MPSTPAIHITGDDAADEVLSEDPFALLVGMMLDQQYPMDKGFVFAGRVTSSISSN